MTTPTAEQCAEALQLAAQLFDARGERPLDAHVSALTKAWRGLLPFTPYWTLVEAAHRIRKARIEQRAELKKAERYVG